MTNSFQKVAAHGLIRKNGKYLLTLRSPVNDYMPNVWDIPGGTIEIGETPEKALIREVKEETDLKIKINKPIFVCSSFGDGKRHQFWIVYECKFISGEVKLNPDEHSSYQWSSLKEIEKLKKIMFVEKFFKSKLD
jgi:8-oxo-dGTP diphosphatase